MDDPINTAADAPNPPWRYALGWVMLLACLPMGFFLVYSVILYPELGWLSVWPALALLVSMAFCVREGVRMLYKRKLKPPGRRNWIILAVKTGLGMLVVATFLPFMLVVIMGVSFPRSAGDFHQAKMEYLVSEVRGRDFKGEQDFLLEPSGEIKAYDDKHPAPGSGGWPQIWARRDADGALTLVLMTVEGGHRISYGFAYSDKPLQLRKAPDNAYVLDVPGPLDEAEEKGRIDDHWWRVYDDRE